MSAGAGSLDSLHQRIWFVDADARKKRDTVRVDSKETMRLDKQRLLSIWTSARLLGRTQQAVERLVHEGRAGAL